MGANISHLSGSTFDEVVSGSSEPVLVDFWAEWCGPCKMIAPVLEELATELDGKLKIAKVDIDDTQNAAIAQRFGIMSIPTLIVFKDGRPQKTIVGAKGKAALSADLAEFI